MRFDEVFKDITNYSTQLQVTPELKQRVINFLMSDGENSIDEIEVTNSYGSDARTFTREQVTEMINKCNDFATLERMILRDFEMESVMSFGEFLDSM